MAMVRVASLDAHPPALTSTVPPDGAVLTQWPAQLELSFSEPVWLKTTHRNQNDFSGFTLAYDDDDDDDDDADEADPGADANANQNRNINSIRIPLAPSQVPI